MPKEAANPRAEALKFIRKKTPAAFIEEDRVLEPVEGIPTGCIAANHVCGIGGFPRGKLTEVFGMEQSGKTTLCIMACGQAQALGLYPVYIDMERGLDFPYATKIGFDVQAAINGANGLYVAPDTFEEAMLIIEQMTEKGGADLIVIDSVAAMTPESAMKGDLADAAPVGAQARLFSQALPKLTKIIARTNTAVVLVNQLRSDIVTGWQPQGAPKTTDKTMGGRAIKYYASIRLEMVQVKKNAKVVEKPSLTNSDRPDQIVVASRHSVLAVKNKLAPPFLRMEFYIRYDPDQDYWGIDNRQTIIDMGLAKSLIDAKGGGYFLYNEMKVQGEDAMYQWFLEHPDALQTLRTEMGV